MVKDVFKELTSTGTDVTLFECPGIKMFKVVEIMLENRSGADATIEIADVFTTDDESKSNVRDTKIKQTLSNGEKLVVRTDGIIVKGKVVANVDGQPFRVTLGLEEV